MKKFKFKLTTLGLLLVLGAASAYAASSWPGGTTATDIASGLSSETSRFDPSGITFHKRYGYVVVGNVSAQLAVLAEDKSGTVEDYWKLTSDPNYSDSGDYEAVAVADHRSDYVYIGEEGKTEVIEFDLASGTLTGREWDLNDVPKSDWAGLEAITFVPEEYAPSSWGSSTSGVFLLASSQAEGTIYVHDIELDYSGGGDQEIESVATIAISYGTNGDSAGMHFSPETERIYVLYDGQNVVEEYTTDGTLMASYSLPSSVAEEGVVIIPHCTDGVADMVFPDDDSFEVNLYEDYPIACDQDGDGIDATIDSNDHIYNAGVEIYGDGIDNDGDGEVDEYNSLEENGVHPYYGELSGSVGAARHVLSVQQDFADAGHVLVHYADDSIYSYEVYPGLVGTMQIRWGGRGGSKPWARISLWTITKRLNVYTGAVI